MEFHRLGTNHSNIKEITLASIPVKESINFKILLVTYKVFHGCTPAYSNEPFIHCMPQHSLRSSSSNLLFVPKTKTPTLSLSLLLLLLLFLLNCPTKLYQVSDEN